MSINKFFVKNRSDHQRSSIALKFRRRQTRAGLFIYPATLVKYMRGCTSLEQKKLLKKLLSTSNSATLQTSPGTTDLLDRDHSTLSDAVKQNIPPISSYSCRNSTVPYLVSLSFALFWIEAKNLSKVFSSCQVVLNIRPSQSSDIQPRCHSRCDALVHRLKHWMTQVAETSEATSFALYFSGSCASLATPLFTFLHWRHGRGICVSRQWRKHFLRIPGFVNSLRGDMPLMIMVGSPVNTAFSSDGRRIVSDP